MAITIKDQLARYTRTVLLADADSTLTAAAKDFFRRDLLNLLTAGSGPEAMHIVRSSRPDIVFMALDLPEGTGDETCKGMKSDSSLRSIPVIMLTAGISQEETDRCRTSGCNEFVQKPLTRQQFQETCRKYLKPPKWSGKRVPTRLPASYGNYSAREFSGLLTDISISGIFLETARVLARNSGVCLEFLLSNTDEPIKCKGRVVRIKAGDAGAAGMGIEFSDIRLLDLLAIQAWISQHA